METNDTVLPTNPEAVNNSLNTQNEQDTNQDKWCFSYYANSEHTDFNEKAALLKNAKWPSGGKITISFMDGDPEVQRRVEKAAMEWVNNGLANLTFEFRADKKDTDIRISFQFAGSWSVLGTTCRNIPKNQPTMNFGWLNRDTPDKELRRVVLHEFGHALGLIHEHMNPEGGIKWNEEQVRKDLKASQGWSDQMIDNNMFKTFTKKELNLTRFDEKSIMLYPVPAKWTLNGFSAGLNTELSEKDKEFIRQQYP